MSSFSIGFLGAGRITRIMLQAWKAAGWQPRNITVFDTEPGRAAGLAVIDPGITVASDPAAAVTGADVVFLAVHPPVLVALLAQVRPSLKPGALVVSLAPKHTLASIQAALGGYPALARVNPSAPGVIGQGINPWCATPGTTPLQTARLEELFRPLGRTPQVAEEKIEAYAVINAMGPTYFWFQWKLLEGLAVEFGMDPAEARNTVAQMVKGASATLYDSGMPREEVMDLVPVKPLGDQEAALTTLYTEKLTAIFNKIRP